MSPTWDDILDNVVKFRHVVDFVILQALIDPEGCYGFPYWLKTQPLQNLTMWQNVTTFRKAPRKNIALLLRTCAVSLQ